MTKNYNINSMDTDTPAAWMSIAARVTPAAQDSGRVRYSVEVEDGKIEALESALNDDDTVIGYEYTGVNGGRYEVYPVGDENARDINRGRLIFASDSLPEASEAATSATGWAWGTAVLDTVTRKIDFGHGFGVPVPDLDD